MISLARRTAWCVEADAAIRALAWQLRTTSLRAARESDPDEAGEAEGAARETGGQMRRAL